MAEDRARMTIVDGADAQASKERTVAISVTNALLLLTLAVAAGVRLWNIASVPPELHPDEYAGWLGITDMLAGRNPPSVFLDYGVVYLPLYGLFETVSALLFGATVTAFRLPAALLGVVTVFATGLLAYQLIPKRAVLVLACAAMALLPWDIAASRIGWEPAAMLPFLLFGIYFLRRGLYAASSRDVVVGLTLLAVGAYSYRAESFYAITLALALVTIEYKRARVMAHALLIGIAAALAVIVPIVLTVLSQPHLLTSGPAQGTFDSGIDANSLAEFKNLYVKHFSLGALFVTGDGNLQHGPPVGVLYPWMAPFILVGLCAPATLVPLRVRLFLLAWLGLYPFGGSLTDESGGQHFIRTIVGAPLFCILTAIGLVVSWQWLNWLGATRRWPGAVASATLTLFAALVIFEFSQFCAAYFIRYPDQAARIFHYGDRDIFAFVKAHGAGAHRLCFTSLDPWNYSAQVRFYLPDAAPRLYGSMDPACRLPKSLLSLQAPSEAPSDAQFLGTVQNRDGTVRAYFYSVP